MEPIDVIIWAGAIAIAIIIVGVAVGVVYAIAQGVSGNRR